MSKISETDHFIYQIIDSDLENDHNNTVVTRFPPEPNGYLHLGHAKSIFLNFGIAHAYQGQCHLRYDDTNPIKEDQKFIIAIEEDLKWLGVKWNKIFYASDYFEQLHNFAVELIGKGLAYVDSLNSDEIKKYRGTLTCPGQNSPFRNRSVEENMNLFARMRSGEFDEGDHVLRAKIDMESANLNLRDPIMYRIRHYHHQKTGDHWCIYPLYDFTHALSDAIEGVTHSICTLEFEDHRILYNWFLKNTSVSCFPHQIEFSRLNLTYTVMSKRILSQLVEENYVDGWDDPRMPTISGLRRRGYTSASLHHFISSIGMTKNTSMIEMSVLENAIRKDLDPISPRVMGVLRPLKVIIENYPEGKQEIFKVKNHPTNQLMGIREITFSREIYIERDDFMENPTSDFFRLSLNREVRLRYGFVILCIDIIKNDNGQVIELRCQYNPETRNGHHPKGRKVRGIIHWVSAYHCVNSEIRLYDRLFLTENPTAKKHTPFIEYLNPQSRIILNGCKLECYLSEVNLQSETRYQFERLGYFYPDTDSNENKLIFNRIVSLRGTRNVKSKI